MSLLNLIKNSSDVRRLFGKREIKIIEKQLLGVRLKNSERTRLSRDIRKKFKVIKELAKYSEEFDLKKASNIKEMIEDAKELILESKYFQRIKKIVLFGSAAENELTFSSDIDIAVEFDNISPAEATEFRIKILGNCPNRMDVQVYNVLPNKIKKEIDEKGKVLYERKNKQHKRQDK